MTFSDQFFIDIHIFLSKISNEYILPNKGKINLSDIKVKNDNSKATIYDNKIEELLINYFKKKNFNSFIAEESFPEFFTDKSKYLTLDPIDGTNNFINGVDKIAIMISYVENEKLIFSIIYNPIKNDFYHVTDNCVFKNFKPHTLKSLDNHIGYLSEIGLTKFSSLVGNFINQEKSRSIGYDLIQILEGDRTFIIIHKGKIWDIFPVLGFLNNVNFNSLNEKNIQFNLNLSKDSFFYYAKI